MKRAQVTLIPTESKKLIAQAVTKMGEVKEAFDNGIVALHPSSSTIFIVEELLGIVPDTEVWVCGAVAPKAACSSAETAAERAQSATTTRQLRSPAEFLHTWVIEKGELKSGIFLGELLARMGPNDVYIKGVNAIDPNNNVGVLIGNQVEGGTIGLVMAQARRKGFKLLFPVGLEKLIPLPIKEAAEEAAYRSSLVYCMGMPCALLPCTGGMVITEPRAIEILAGATAVPISAGGLVGAEGAITIIIKGDEQQVAKAVECIEGVKGAQLPRELQIADCQNCSTQSCSLNNQNKPWC